MSEGVRCFRVRWSTVLSDDIHPVLVYCNKEGFVKKEYPKLYAEKYSSFRKSAEIIVEAGISFLLYLDNLRNKDYFSNILESEYVFVDKVHIRNKM